MASLYPQVLGNKTYEQQYQAKVLASLEKRAKELGYKLVPTN
jgi:hypothetical protein